MDDAHRPGLEEVAAGETAISTLEGGLFYRGYAVEDLAANATFEETAYLLLYGELPTAVQLDAFRRRIGESAAVEPRVLEALRLLPETTPMIDALRTGASLLAHWDDEAPDNSHAANVRKAERLIAQLPAVMAAAQRMRGGKKPLPPNPELSHAANVLWMVEGAAPPPWKVRAMDVSLIAYAELEFNASTFAARIVASTGSDLHSAIVAALGALKGPLHGGANARVMQVLQEVGSPHNAERWVRTALDQKRRIMGFGHRVFRSGDPRAILLKPWCVDLAQRTGQEALEQTADAIERLVGETKPLAPNVDWPSARLYHYLGLPVALYTPLFAVARVVGWSAHAIEQLDKNRLIRPRARYVGPARRRWQPLAARPAG